MRRVDRDLNVGDLVLLNIGAARDIEGAEEGVSKKLRCDWYGPYRIKETIKRRVNSSNEEYVDTLNYLIEPAHPNVSSTLAEGVVHVRRLKKLSLLPEEFRARKDEIQLMENDIADMDEDPAAEKILMVTREN